MDTDPNNTREPAPRSSVLIPVVVLSLFAALLPARLTSSGPGPSNEVCLTLAEQRRTPSPPLDLLETCSALYPDDIELLADLGSVSESSDPEKAEALYRRVLASDPGYADVRLRLARLLLRRGDHMRAAAEAQRGLATQPNRQAFVDLLAAARRRAAEPR